LAGPNMRAAIAPLIDTLPLYTRVAATGLNILRKEAVGAPVAVLDSVATVGSGKISPRGRARADRGRLPASVAIRHYDAARDYQSGVQRAGITVAGDQEITIDLPAVLSADDARNLAHSFWLHSQTNAATSQLSVPLAATPLQIGEVLGDDGECIVEIEHNRGFSVIKTSHWPRAMLAPLGTVDGGEHIAEPDALAGETMLAVVDLPPLPNAVNQKPQIGIAAAGTGAGWRRAALSIALDGGASVDLGRTARPACLGSLVAPLPPHPAHLLDMDNAIEVDLLAGASAFATGFPLDPAAPIIHLGGEFARYGLVEQIGQRRFRLSKLLRGLWSSGNDQPHASGTVIMVLDAATVLAPDLPTLSIGSTAEIEALGLGDSQPSVAAITVTGRAITPLSPVHGRSEKLPSGGLALSWIRRSRADTGWQDNVELPQGEEALLFDVAIFDAATAIASFTSAAEQLDIPAAQVAGWGFASGTNLTAKVRQVGQLARSPWHDIAIVV
jgi:Putative phage tail protein